MVGGRRIELLTSSVSRKRSPTELTARKAQRRIADAPKPVKAPASGACLTRLERHPPMSALRQRVAEAARRMSTLLVEDITLEAVFASLADLLATFVEATEVVAILREGQSWLRLAWADGNLRRNVLARLSPAEPLTTVVRDGIAREAHEPAAMAMPLRIGDEAVGGFAVRSGALRSYDEADAAVIESLGPYVAVALRQRMLREQIDRERFRADHDPLTTLPNRAAFAAALTHALGRVRRSGDRLAVLFIDLDGFKAINDSFGHEAGDAVLRSASRRLLRRLRTGDSVARLGGDEFATILRGIGNEEDARSLAEEVRAALERPMTWRGNRLRVGASIGWAIAPRDGTEIAELLRRSDHRMYRDKRARREHNARRLRK